MTQTSVTGCSLTLRASTSMGREGRSVVISRIEDRGFAMNTMGGAMAGRASTSVRVTRSRRGSSALAREIASSRSPPMAR